MAEAITNAGTAPRDMSFAARIIGILASPGAAYADVARKPRIVAALAVILTITVGATFLFMSTEVGKQALLEQQVRSLESFGRTVTDQQYQRFEQMGRIAPYFAAAGQLVSLPL